MAADLHNHSLYSDGLGDPERAFAQLRAAGLDVAALTDHASIPRHAVRDLSLAHYPDARALAIGRLAPRSFDEAAWARTATLADAHDVPGEFTALRGFEWTEPWLGHVNVWFSDTFTDVTTPGSLSGLFGFLTHDEPDALFGYNHPGREPGRLAAFAGATGDLPRRMVAVEAFNRTDDFLFGGYEDGHPSPLVACLDAGWRPAFIGCSDEHGRSYGLAGKGRTGLWVRELSRAGVREALLARRAFATREPGLRLDARLAGGTMGSALDVGAAGGTFPLEVDLAGSAYAQAQVEFQVLTSASPSPLPDGTGIRVLHRAPAVVGEVTTVDVDVPAGTRWVALRVADPRRGYGGPAPSDHPCASWALAYASPWYLTTG